MAKLRQRKDRENRHWLISYYDPFDKERPNARYQIDTGTTDKSLANLWMAEFERRYSLAKIGQIEKIGRISVQELGGKKYVPQETRIKSVKLSEYQKQYEHLSRTELNLAEKTIETNNNAFASFIERVGDKFLDNVTQEDFRRWQDKLREQGRSLATQSIYGRAIKTVWVRAVDNGYLEQNLFSRIRTPTSRQTRRVDKTMGVGEVKTLFQITEDAGYKPLADYFRTLLYLGVRREEGLKLRGEDIDLENRIVSVNVGKKRGGPVRMQFPINDALYKVFSQMDIKRGEYLFKTTSRKNELRKRGLPWGAHYVSHAFKKMLQKAGLPEKYSLHSLRRTYITYLHSKGVPIDVIQRLVGHATPDVTWRSYDDTTPLSFRAYANLINLEEKGLEERV